MKKTLSILVAFVAMITFTSCESKDGDWEEMKWQKVTTETVKVEGYKCYSVPVEGGRYQFKCLNYSSFWISSLCVTHSIADWTGHNGIYYYPDCESNPANDRQNLSAEGITVSIEGNTMTVSFDENKSFAKFVDLHVTAGDIFETFRFVQNSNLYTN